ncbi:zinc finger MYM-type protein 1-like [Gymnodraco acuticeps]|uniref:Zinc finger MYM-type protein 1-like n=1 Tax=Gymnodraco acuticeps TaxID=8218 RepID=A0A6P8T3V6_GYMAC|nr:zinc finger MYM-type protein 1-like [Gymnodraco acuticeps]
MLDTMVTEIKQSKYYSIILDCTPDVSHQEQMSVIIRTVIMDEAPTIKEHFLGFLVASETTGLGLSSLILNRLKELNIPFDNCRGQSYDNGANMKGRNRGVQARLLQKNPRALYVPCVSHSLYLVVADAAKASTDAISYFGNVQKLYTLFSAAPQRWAILKEHLTFALKSWSDTRWESRVNSIEAVRYQAPNIREVLLEVSDKVTDPLTKVEAQSLAEEVGSYRFLICTVVWYDILHHVNHVSKLLQSATMQLDVAVDLLTKANMFLTRYRDTGFAAAQATAKDMCEEINVEAVLKEKRMRSTKKHFAYEAPDEPIADAMKRLETTFFNVVVDTTIESLKDRFETLGEVRARFGVLLNLKKLDRVELCNQCDKLCSTLSTGDGGDIDGKELALEITNLPSLPTCEMTALELLSFIHKKNLNELYPNLWIALRIACTLPVTVAAAERSFSKLKLIKTYLRSCMGQDRLTGLAIISINHKIGKQLSYDDIIDDFASKKARKQKF